MSEQLENSIETNVDAAASSGQNVLHSLADMLGLDLSELSLTRLLGSVVLLVVLIAISKLIAGLAGHALKRSRLGAGLKRFIAKAIKYVLYFISIMIFGDSIGIPITSLLAIFSLLGLAVSLSIQNLLGNVMSGISLLMLKPFDIGDYIETDVAGTVKNIGLFYTEILTLDNKCVYIPNEVIMGSKLINYNSENTRRIDVRVNAAYGFDIAAVKAALTEAAESVDAVLKDKPIAVGVADYGDSAILYDVLVWVNTSDYIAAKYALMEAIAESYAKHGIEMAYNRLEVNLIK